MSLGILFVVFSAFTAVEPVEPISIAELDRWVPGLLRASGVPGLSMALVKDGRIALLRGFGIKDENTREPVDPRTVFEAASLSKPIFAYAVLLLAGTRKLDLDMPLTRYTEEPYLPDERLELITARVVLSHSTGFPNWRPRRWTDAPGPLTIDFDPGTRFGYSGEGYEYLKLVVERIVAGSIEEYLQEAVLRPIGMTSSSYVWRDAYDETAATGHDRVRQPAKKWRPTAANVAGSLHTTAEDYARFLVAVLRSAPGEPGALMMARETTIDDRLGWGMGWGLEKLEAGEFFWHWGDNDSFQALVMGSRAKGTAVVVLTNGENGLRACQAIVRAVLGREHPALDFPLLSY